MGTDGVGGVYVFDPCPAILKLPPPPIDGVVGVIGNEPSWDEGDPRLVALLIGRKMPAPDMEVEK